MRSAPAVTVRCSGGRIWRLLVCSLPSLATAALFFWALQHAGVNAGWAGLLAAVGGAVVAWWAWRGRPAPRVMCWDGTAWACDGLPVQPQVMVDTGGSWMLLRLRSAVEPGQSPRSGWHALCHAMRQTQWLAVCEPDAGPLWHPWRAAVYCFEPLTTANRSERPII